MVVRAAGLSDLAALAVEMTRVGNAENRYICYRQVASFRFELDKHTQLNVDGEPMDTHALDFHIHPRRLRVILPPEAPVSDHAPDTDYD